MEGVSDWLIGLDWTKTFQGSLVILAIAATAYAARALISHLVANVKARREDLQKQIDELKRQMTIERLECREDALNDSNNLKSLIAIGSKFQVAVMSVSSGKRSAPPGFDDIVQEFQEVRRRVHNQVNDRSARLATARLMAQQQRAPSSTNGNGNGRH